MLVVTFGYYTCEKMMQESKPVAKDLVSRFCFSQLCNPCSFDLKV